MFNFEGLLRAGAKEKIPLPTFHSDKSFSSFAKGGTKSHQSLYCHWAIFQSYSHLKPKLQFSKCSVYEYEYKVYCSLR